MVDGHECMTRWRMGPWPGFVHIDSKYLAHNDCLNRKIIPHETRSCMSHPAWILVIRTEGAKHHSNSSLCVYGGPA
jgi:hypothetical protein